MDERSQALARWYARHGLGRGVRVQAEEVRRPRGLAPLFRRGPLGCQIPDAPCPLRPLPTRSSAGGRGTGRRCCGGRTGWCWSRRTPRRCGCWPRCRRCPGSRWRPHTPRCTRTSSAGWWTRRPCTTSSCGWRARRSTPSRACTRPPSTAGSSGTPTRRGTCWTGCSTASRTTCRPSCWRAGCCWRRWRTSWTRPRAAWRRRSTPSTRCWRRTTRASRRGWGRPSATSGRTRRSWP